MFFTKLILCDLGKITSCDNTGFYNSDDYIGNNQCTTNGITNTPSFDNKITRTKIKVHKTNSC